VAVAVVTRWQWQLNSFFLQMPSWCEKGRDKLTFLDVSRKNLNSDYPQFVQSLPIKADNIASRSVADLHGSPTEHMLRRVQSWTHQSLFTLFSLLTPYTSWIFDDVAMTVSRSRQFWHAGRLSLMLTALHSPCQEVYTQLFLFKRDALVWITAISIVDVNNHFRRHDRVMC